MQDYSGHEPIQAGIQEGGGGLFSFPFLLLMLRGAHPYTMLDRFWGMNLLLLRVSIS